MIFLAADYDSVNRLKDQVRSTLAWQSIVADIKEMKLNLDQFQARQANKTLEEATEALRRMIRETYKWILAPMQEARPGKSLSEIQWEHFPVNPGAQHLSQEVEHVLKENELLITEWAPIHLATVLKRWFWKDGVKEVSALDVWQQSCQQLYLPRLKDDRVFRHTLAAGAESRDFFGFAQGLDERRYVGFSYGERAPLIMDASLLLIEPIAAAVYLEAQRAAEAAARAKPTDADTGSGVGPGSGGGTTATGAGQASSVGETGQGSYSTSGSPTAKPAKGQFYGSIELDPILAKKQFADLVDEVIAQFTMRTGVKVRIAVEIQAESAGGFEDSLQRTVKENCNVLKFRNSEFEE